MAEQTFRSPGFFENEIDLSARDVEPSGVPAGVIGTAEKGPAFVPVTMGNFGDFITRFGSLDPERFAPYAVKEWLKNKNSLTFVRVLGAGSNTSPAHFSDTKTYGTVKNAGFIVSASRYSASDVDSLGTHESCTQFLVARHTLPNLDGGEMFGFPMFTDNNSFQETTADTVKLVRGVLFTTTGSRFEIAPGEEMPAHAEGVIKLGTADATTALNSNNLVFTVPTAAGGDNTAVTISFHNEAWADGAMAAAANTIKISKAVADTTAKLQAALIGAINHTNANAAAQEALGYKIGTAGGANGIKGVTATASPGAPGAQVAISLTADLKGVVGNTISLTTNKAVLRNNGVLSTNNMQGGRGIVYDPLPTNRQLKAGNAVTPSHWFAGSDSKYKSSQSYFKLILSTSLDEKFGKGEGAAVQPGIKIFTASLEPSDPNYISKILNTNPQKFYHERHLLYLDFAVESELAKVDTTFGSLGLLSGSSRIPMDTQPVAYGGTAKAEFTELFGRFDTRYTTPKSPSIISQPFGGKEWDLFHFETISDGAWGNSKYKVSIANVRASTDPVNRYGTFEVQLRDFSDTDRSPAVLERFPECTLNPQSERYVARQVGDMKAYWNFDAESDDERRVVVKGKYPNRSHRFRIVMNEAVERELSPDTSLPFGFRGMEVLKTTDSLTDEICVILTDADGNSVGTDEGDNGSQAAGRFAPRLTGHGLSTAKGLPAVSGQLTGSIIPPLPYRFKVTKGAVSSANPAGAAKFVGEAGKNERVDPRLYWGVKTTRTPISASLPSGDVNSAVLNANDSRQPNPLVEAYTKMHGIGKLGTLVTGSAAADEFNNNKFTLARVALQNSISDAFANGVSNRLEKIVTGTARQHLLEASYIRNGRPKASNYTISDRIKGDRITMGTLVHSSSVIFNRFIEFNKFTTIFAGGFDGTNILSHDGYYMTDRASSGDLGGYALSTTEHAYQGLTHIVAGTGGKNAVINSYETAVRIMTDPTTVRINLLAIPGMRDPNIVDNALDKVRDYGFSMYVMDVRNYDQDVNRLFDDDIKKPDVRTTSEQFDGLAIDNNYAASYFPDVFLKDEQNNRPVKVPASVAAISALGFNDRVGFPWFAPAGFNRGSLASVDNVHTRLSSNDRDELYDVRINPIAVFPTGRFVIFGQKTLQQAKSALDRVNVRRLLLEVKRRVSSTARKLLFEANDATTRAQFVGEVTPQLAIIQAQAGVERFSVVCDGTNNSTTDEEESRMNGRIVIVPTLAVEFIALDFIVTSAGVSFE